MFARILLLTALAAAVAPAAQQGALVYIKSGDVWIMNTDGSSQIRLTTVGDALQPRLANNTLFFKSGGQLYRAPLLGFALQSPAQAIPSTSGVLDYAPNSTATRLVLTYQNNFTCYTMNADGTGTATLNATASMHQHLFSWGRDGYIYFVQSAFGNAFSQLLYRIPENGLNNPTVLTNYFSQFPAAGGPGQKVAFLYNHPVKYIRTMNPDGSNQQDVPGVNTGDGGFIGIDQFADVIYYTYYDQIWRVNLDGSGNLQLTSGAYPNYVGYGLLDVDNTPPVVTSVTATPNPVAKGASLSLTATLLDTGGSGLSIAHYTIDGSTPQLMGTPSGASAVLTIPLAPFPSAAVHTLCVRAQDLAGNISEETCTFVPVYDPDAGFVTGAGWFQSASGKANLGFVAKYHANSQTPTGNLEFQVGTLKFKASSFDWLVINGGTAQLAGAGTVNGSGSYQFLLTALDHTLDSVALKIWSASGTVFESPSTPMGGGQIKIH